jgi:hypothetical protein
MLIEKDEYIKYKIKSGHPGVSAVRGFDNTSSEHSQSFKLNVKVARDIKLPTRDW